jgi:hypothetical protein
VHFWLLAGTQACLLCSSHLWHVVMRMLKDMWVAWKMRAMHAGRQHERDCMHAYMWKPTGDVGTLCYSLLLSLPSPDLGWAII